MQEKIYSFGIKNYKPTFFYSTDMLLLEKSAFFESLIGEKIESIMIVWSLEHKENWLDAPIVLVTEKNRVEICCQKTNELSITQNTFSFEDKINWYGDNRFEWRKLKAYNSEFFITNIKILELFNEISNVSNDDSFKSQWWDLGGIKFESSTNEICIWNGLDTNVLSFDSSSEKGIREIKYR